MITEVFDPHSPALISPEQAVPPEELAEITFRNACALYRIPA